VTFGLSDLRIIELSDYRTFGLSSSHRNNSPDDDDDNVHSTIICPHMAENAHNDTRTDENTALMNELLAKTSH